MKLHILSDLHTEFAEFDPPETDADIVVLAGDVGVGTAGIEWAGRQFKDKPVIYVPGNHEYYHHDIGITDALKSAAPANVHVLDRDVSAGPVDPRPYPRRLRLRDLWHPGGVQPARLSR